MDVHDKNQTFHYIFGYTSIINDMLLAKVLGDIFRRIIYYKSFKSLSAANKRETVVHEVGHTIGLSHTQQRNNSISVMRDYRFNGKAYPLSDDKKGINAKY